MTRDEGIATLADGRGLLSRLPRQVGLDRSQLSMIAAADRTFVDAIQAAESFGPDDGARAIKIASAILAPRLCSLAVSLPDGQHRDDVIELNAHLELLARSQGVRS